MNDCRGISGSSCPSQPRASQPTLHALCLAALRVEPGETVVHVGAGSGYYSGILSELTGPTGSVVAYEIEPELARRATDNLADRRNVAGPRDA